MKYVLPTAMAAALLALAGCDRPASTSSTTVVQPTKEKETIVQRDVPSTTIVNPAPATPPATTNVTIDATKPETTTTERSRTTERVETPLGTATRTETTKTTKQ